MKKFLNHVILFSLPIILLITGLEVSIRQIPNNYTHKQEQLIKGKKTEVLILGNSHSVFGIDPQYFDKKTFNAAMISQPLEVDLFLLKSHIDDLPKLSHIVLNFSIPNLYSSFKFKDSDESWRIKNYNLYMNANFSYNPKNYFELTNESIKGSIAKIDKYHNTGSILTSDSFGFIYREGILPKYTIEQGIQRVQLHCHEKNKSLVYNIKLLHEFFSICKEKKIKILLITLPTRKEYYQNIKYNIQKERDSLSRIFMKKYDFITYHNLEKDTSFISIDFWDQDHLNSIGAKKMSIILNEKINNFE